MIDIPTDPIVAFFFLLGITTVMGGGLWYLIESIDKIQRHLRRLQNMEDRIKELEKKEKK